MNTPLISVNMCVWRPHSRHFVLAVESILGQTFPDFELIIVEDPSEYDGAVLLNGHLNDRRIRYIQNSTRTGLVSQRNQALRLSRGKFIAFLDADDIAEPSRFENQLSFLETSPDIAFLGSNISVIDENDKIFAYREYPNGHANVKRAMQFYCALAFPTVTCAKEAVLALGGFEGNSYVIDFDLWCRALVNGYLIDNVPEALVRYRVYRNARTRSKARRVLAATIRVKLHYLRHIMSVSAYARLVCEIALLTCPNTVLNGLFRRLVFKPAGNTAN